MKRLAIDLRTAFGGAARPTFVGLAIDLRTAFGGAARSTFVGLAIALVVTAACSSKNKGPDGPGSSAAIYAKKMSLSWGFQPNGKGTDVFLQTTDETGRQVSYPLGTFDGHCNVITPAPEMAAITAVGCEYGPAGTELHAIVKGDDVIVVKLRVDSGVKADPMAREEVKRVTAPTGAKIEAGS
jgi:hypothetical protein